MQSGVDRAESCPGLGGAAASFRADVGMPTSVAVLRYRWRRARLEAGRVVQFIEDATYDAPGAFSPYYRLRRPLVDAVGASLYTTLMWWRRTDRYEQLPTGTSSSSIGKLHCLTRRRICVIVSFAVLACVALISYTALEHQYDVLTSIRDSIASGSATQWLPGWMKGDTQAMKLLKGPPTLTFAG